MSPGVVSQTELENLVKEVQAYQQTVDKHHSVVKKLEDHIDSAPHPSRLVDSVIQQMHEHTVSLSVCLSVCSFVRSVA